jgi:hypothetical protein
MSTNYQKSMKPYYYVYRVGYGCPTVKHPDLPTAANESRRLAAQHPGATFEILQCVGTTRTINPQTFWMDGWSDPAACMRDDGKGLPTNSESI